MQLSAVYERINTDLKTSCCKINLLNFLNECNCYNQFYTGSILNQMLLWHLLSCTRNCTLLPNSNVRKAGASPIVLFFFPFLPFHKVLSCSLSFCRLHRSASMKHREGQ